MLFLVSLFLSGLLYVISSNSILFLETFEEDVFESGRWQKSSTSDVIGQPVKIKPCRNPGKGFEKDNALELTQSHKKYAVGVKFSDPIDPKDKDFVVQYETKFEEMVTCGGAYLKLLRQTDNLDITQLDSSTPYSIMFGPDKCGHDTNKVHFILNHQNPITKKWEEKHFESAPSIKNDKKSHLYTLHISSNNSFEIFIDMESAAKGSLLTDMKPSVNPPAEIDDPTDSKPVDWVDEAQIPDSTATKPDDWDESAPLMIDDISDTKPADWEEDTPEMIADPKAEKPSDWDDEEDGEWEAPTVANPACLKISGCGPWKRAQVKNPAYKGKWRPPMIANPAYAGEWRPRQVPNPEHFLDPRPADFHPIGGVAVEVWTIDEGYRFDNILFAHSLAAAFQYAKESFEPKMKAEKAVEPDEKEDGKAADYTSLAYWKLVVMAHYLNVLKLREQYPLQFTVGTTMFMASLLVFVILYGSRLQSGGGARKKAGRATVQSGETGGGEEPEEKAPSAVRADADADAPVAQGGAGAGAEKEDDGAAGDEGESKPTPNSPSRRKRTPKDN